LPSIKLALSEEETTGAVNLVFSDFRSTGLIVPGRTVGVWLADTDGLMVADGVPGGTVAVWLAVADGLTVVDCITGRTGVWLTDADGSTVVDNVPVETGAAGAHATKSGITKIAVSVTSKIFFKDILL